MRVAYSTSTQEALVDALVLEVTVNGGFSVNALTGEPVTEGFALSIYPDRERKIGTPVTAADLKEFVFDNADLLAKPGKIFGAWRDEHTGITYLDVSTVEHDKSTAIIRGRANAQLAIFDLSAKEEIYL